MYIKTWKEGVNMKIVVAIDSLKGSLSSIEAGNCIRDGILKVYNESEVEIIVKPLADGGEGTLEALACGMDGTVKILEVSGPLMKPVNSKYGYVASQQTAIIEMATASGLGLVAINERNPRNTTTYGVGEIIKQCIDDGVRHFVVGIGGSATNDCGTGMLTALGYKFLDQDGNELEGTGENLIRIKSIDDSGVVKNLKDCTFKVACDVNNPLCAEFGASYIFGPQKGASPSDVKYLDEGCENFASVVKEKYGKDNKDKAGAGAAGGLGYGFMTFLGAELKSGVDIVLEALNIKDNIVDADYVITGEGKLDSQTVMGKAPIGVAKLAKMINSNVKVIALAGAVGEDSGVLNDNGIDAYFSITNSPMSLEKAMDINVASENMAQTAEQIFRLIKSVQN